MSFSKTLLETLAGALRDVRKNAEGASEFVKAADDVAAVTHALVAAAESVSSVEPASALKPLPSLDAELRSCMAVLSDINALHSLKADADTAAEKQRRFNSEYSNKAPQEAFAKAVASARQAFDQFIAAETHRFTTATERIAQSIATCAEDINAVAAAVHRTEQHHVTRLGQFVTERDRGLVKLLESKARELRELEEKQARLHERDPALAGVEEKKDALVRDAGAMREHLEALRLVAIKAKPDAFKHWIAQHQRAAAVGSSSGGRAASLEVDMSGVPVVAKGTPRAKRKRCSDLDDADEGADSGASGSGIAGALFRGVAYLWENHMCPRDTMELSSVSSGANGSPIDTDADPTPDALPRKSGRMDEFAVPATLSTSTPADVEEKENLMNERQRRPQPHRAAPTAADARCSTKRAGGSVGGGLEEMRRMVKQARNAKPQNNGASVAAAARLAELERLSHLPRATMDKEQRRRLFETSASNSARSTMVMASVATIGAGVDGGSRRDSGLSVLSGLSDDRSGARDSTRSNLSTNSSDAMRLS